MEVLARGPASRSAATRPRARRSFREVEDVLVRLVSGALPFEGSAGKPEIEAERWPEIVEAAGKHGLAPLLYASLKKQGAPAAVPAAVVERLRLSYLQTSIASWFAFEQLSTLLALFEGAGIPVILLKGCALGLTLYEDPALRPMGDLDLLVRRQDSGRVYDLLVEQGFEPQLEIAAGFGVRFLNERTFLRSGSRPAQVDVHHYLLGIPYYCERIDIEWFWRRVVEIDAQGRTAYVFAPEAQLLHLSAHLAYHHSAGRLIWSYDLASLLARYGGEIDWGEVIEAAARFGLTQALKAGLAGASRWGVYPPAAASKGLASSHAGLRERLLMRVAASPASGLDVLAYGLGVPGLRPKLAFCLRRMFPGVAFMRHRYGVASGWLLPLCYSWRIARGAYKPARFAASALWPGAGVKR